MFTAGTRGVRSLAYREGFPADARGGDMVKVSCRRSSLKHYPVLYYQT
ncbi:MAG: hypothetical protein MZV63_02915 [Marinilabiliales bacterium]|nr:hypothetical protein [Marinilabiliales bacterium]